MPIEKVSAIYNSGEYFAHNPTWGREDSLWKVKQILKVIPKKFFVDNYKDKGIAVADIGCGGGGVIGNFVGILKERGYSIACAVGFDIGKIPVEMAKKEWKNVEFVNGTIGDDDRKFDIGLLVDVIEHIENPGDFVRACGKSCKYLLLHIPLEDNYNFKLRNQYEYVLKKFGHINYFNARSCIEFLETSGMKIVNYKYTPGFILPSARIHLPAKIALIPRLLLGFISKPFCARTLGGYHLTAFAESKCYLPNQDCK